MVLGSSAPVSSIYNSNKYLRKRFDAETKLSVFKSMFTQNNMKRIAMKVVT
jgi:hypothetical protein